MILAAAGAPEFGIRSYITLAVGAVSQSNQGAVLSSCRQAAGCAGDREILQSNPAGKKHGIYED